MARKSKTTANSSRNQAAKLQAANKQRQKEQHAKQRARLKEQQKQQRETLKARQKQERARIKEYRHGGAMLKRKKVAGFTEKDLRSALPSLTFRKTGKTKSKAERTIARLNDVIEGVGKLITVKSKKQRDELKAKGVIVHGNKALVQKDQYIPKGKAEIRPQHIGRVAARIRVEHLEDDIRRYFARHPGKEVGVQLGDGQYPLYLTFDDPDTLIEYLESNFSSAIEKEAFDEIILITADQINKVRHKLAERRRKEMKLKPSRAKPVDTERQKLRAKQTDRRYYLRNKAKILAKAAAKRRAKN